MADRESPRPPWPGPASPCPEEWKRLLTLLLAQRLELNAIESAIHDAGILSAAQIKNIRTQAMDTAKAWSANETDDVLTLLGIHSSTHATMLIPLDREPKIEPPK